jgi:uncharacterized protein DUF6908
VKPLSQAAARVLDRLTADLLPLSDDGAAARRVGEKGGVYMQVVVERLDANCYSVAHYYEQNGDLMRDPEMCFVRANGAWYATYFRQDGIGLEQRSAEYNPATGGFSARPRQQAQHASFANTWMRNIRAQQPEFFRGGSCGGTAHKRAILQAVRQGRPLDLRIVWMQVVELQSAGLLVLEKQPNGQLLIRELTEAGNKFVDEFEAEDGRVG